MAKWVVNVDQCLEFLWECRSLHGRRILPLWLREWAKSFGPGRYGQQMPLKHSILYLGVLIDI